MLRSSLQLMAVLYLLRETTSCNSNNYNRDIATTKLQAEATSIVECFIKTVDTPWQFSDNETSRVHNFYLFTFGLCEISLWRIFECYSPLMSRIPESFRLNDLSIREENKFIETNDLKYIEKAADLKGEAVEVIENLISLIVNIKQMAVEINETRLLSDNCSKSFLDVDSLRNKSSALADYRLPMLTYLQITQINTDTLWYVMPPFITIIFVCGMIGNGVLLVIFWRHPEARAGPNAMLVNLAISDTLFLIGNIALDYCKLLWGFPFGTEACFVYNFYLTLITGSCVYSMVLLSVCRYIATTAKPGSRGNKFLSSMPVMLAAIWILSAIVAIPDTLSTEITTNCGGVINPLNSICDFFFISFLPLITITGFYIAASRRLQESARNMPGEFVGRNTVKLARQRGAKILPALAFVFAITYLPFYTLFAVVTILGIDYHEYPTAYIIFYIATFAFNLNSTLNPCALYLASSMFRNYFKNYLCLGFVKKRNHTEDINKAKVANTKT